MRLGRVPVRAGRRAARPHAAYGGDADQRAAPAPLRVQQRTTASSSRRTGWSSPAPAPTATLVEIDRAARPPWFLAVQFHPEFKSKPTRAHPLFRDFVAAALARREAGRAELEVR